MKKSAVAEAALLGLQLFAIALDSPVGSPAMSACEADLKSEGNSEPENIFAVSFLDGEGEACSLP